MGKNRRTRLLAVAVLSGVAGMVSHASADTFVWVGGTSTNYQDAANWTVGGDPAVTAPGASDLVLFDATGAAPPTLPQISTTSGDLQLGGMVVDNSGGYVWQIARSGNSLAGRSLALSNGFTVSGGGFTSITPSTFVISVPQTWNVGSNTTVAATNLAGSSTIDFSGGGTLLFTAAADLASFTGGWNVTGGRVQVVGASAFGPAGASMTVSGTGQLITQSTSSITGPAVILKNGATLGGTSLPTGATSTGFASASLTIDNAVGATVSLRPLTSSDYYRVTSSPLGGTGVATSQININGGGIVEIANANSGASAFNGKWVVSGGSMLRAMEGTALGARSGSPGQLEMLSGATFALAFGQNSSTLGTMTSSIVISGSSTFLVERSALVAAANTTRTSSGALTIGASTLTIAAGRHIGAGTTSTWNHTGTVQLTGNATFELAGSTLAANLGAVSGSGFGFTKSGAGSLLLTGSTPSVNTYTGPTTITGGSLTFNGYLATNSSPSSPTFVLANNSNLNFGRGGLTDIWVLRNTFVGNGTIGAFANNNSTLNLQGATLTPGGAATSGKINLNVGAGGTKAVAFSLNGSTPTTLNIDITGANAVAGVDFDQLALTSGTVTSAGLASLRLVLNVGGSLTLPEFIGGQMMNIISAPGTNFGALAAFNAIVVPPAWDAYDRITYGDGFVAVQLPEPSSLGLLGLGALGLLRRRRRT